MCCFLRFSSRCRQLCPLWGRFVESKDDAWLKFPDLISIFHVDKYKCGASSQYTSCTTLTSQHGSNSTCSNTEMNSNLTERRLLPFADWNSMFVSEGHSRKTISIQVNLKDIWLTAKEVLRYSKVPWRNQHVKCNKFFLPWNAHPNARPRVLPVATGGSTSKEALRRQQSVRDMIGLCARLRIDCVKPTP